MADFAGPDFLTKKKFQGKAKYSATGRTRNFEIFANDFDDCKRVLSSKGFAEPFEIIEMPPEPATQSQKEYAYDLKLHFPNDISKRDLSFLISKTVDREGEPNPELLQYAINRSIADSPYIGKRTLYDLIFASLEGCDKVAFFLFCVYRYCTDDRYGDLDTHKSKDVFYALAEDLASDDRFIGSMNKYEGQALRYFGTLHVKESNGYIIDIPGGSTETIAYKQAVQYLQSKFTLPLRTSKTIEGNRNNSVTHSASANSPQIKNKLVSLALSGIKSIVNLTKSK